MANRVTQGRFELQSFGSDPDWLENAVSHAESTSFEYAIAASGSQTVNFGSIATATVVVVTCDTTFSVTANGADTAQTYAANGFHVQFNTSVTALVVANTDGSNAGTAKVWLMGA